MTAVVKVLWCQNSQSSVSSLFLGSWYNPVKRYIRSCLIIYLKKNKKLWICNTQTDVLKAKSFHFRYNLLTCMYNFSAKCIVCCGPIPSADEATRSSSTVFNAWGLCFVFSFSLIDTTFAFFSAFTRFKKTLAISLSNTLTRSQSTWNPGLI